MEDLTWEERKKIFDDELKVLDAFGLKQYGYSVMVSFLLMEHLSYSKRCFAKCYQCMGYCADGAEECNDILCPLFPISQFNPDNFKKYAKKETNTQEVINDN